MVEQHNDVAPTRRTEPCELNDLLVPRGGDTEIGYMWCGAMSMYLHLASWRHLTIHNSSACYVLYQNCIVRSSVVVIAPGPYVAAPSVCFSSTLSVPSVQKVYG